MRELKIYKRRFKRGASRFSTRAWMECGDVIIKQTERFERPKMDCHSVVKLPLRDFKKMCSQLGLEVARRNEPTEKDVLPGSQ